MKSLSNIYGESSIEQIKHRLGNVEHLLTEYGVEVRGKRFVCPFHQDTEPSGSIYDNGERFKCFGCGVGGDVITLWGLFHKLDNKHAFCELLNRYADRNSWKAISKRRPQKARLKKKIKSFSEILPECTQAQLERMDRASKCLLNKVDYMNRLAKARGWKVETLRQLALEPSLGYENRKLVFLYSHGMKMRWKNKKGERDFFWDRYCPAPWRWQYMHLLEKPSVYITEGETDTITLIDRGFENEDVAIVALPSASTIRVEWREIFAGRDMVFFMDNNQAGFDARDKMYALFAGSAKSFSVCAMATHESEVAA